VNIGVIDLFCGAGGLTRGLEAEGLEVLVGFDLDPACRYPYEANNFSRFNLADVAQLTGASLKKIWAGSEIRVLAGCAPCQPFSRYTQARAGRDKRWTLLRSFSRLIAETRPDIVTMENVPELTRHGVYRRFVSSLRRNGYTLSENIVECVDYGIPQQRKRLVLIASRLGRIDLVPPAAFGCTPSTVRDAISAMPELAAGDMDELDSIHRSSSLSTLNKRRIRSSRPGGTWKDWDGKLVALCHRRKKGKGYRAVYGRMEWDRPAPTITTQAYGFGSGRFGHPEQDRALSLREAAMLQTFPRDYAFAPRGGSVEIKTIGRLIGNAVPVRLGRVVGRSIKLHLDSVHLAEQAEARAHTSRRT